MNKLIYSLMTLVCMGLFSMCTVDVSAQSKEKMDVYLLIGQSNMAGRAEYKDADFPVLKSAYLFTNKNKWTDAENPLNRFSNILKRPNLQKYGPGYSFAKAMIKDNPDRKIGLVVNARGGSSIDLWLKDKKYYNASLSRIKAAMKQGEIKAVLWHQGESSVNDPDYVEKLASIVRALRKDLGKPDLPFVAGQIKPEMKAFNTNLLKLKEMVPYTEVVSSKGLKTFDKWHFDQKSVSLLGERYAEKTILLLNK